MEESPNLRRGASGLNVARLTLALHFAGNSFPRGVRGLKVTPQAHVKGDCNAHHDQRTDTQDQEPPDHPHNGLG
jgi:hypothetical protein